MEEKKIGVVSHYFSKVGVGTIKLTDGPLNVGDTVHIKGRTTDLTQKVESMQLEHQNIESAKNGDDVGIKVNEHVREHDEVYKVIE